MRSWMSLDLIRDISKVAATPMILDSNNSQLWQACFPGDRVWCYD